MSASMEEMLEQQNDVDNVLSSVMELSSDTDIRAIESLWKHVEADKYSWVIIRLNINAKPVFMK